MSALYSSDKYFFPNIEHIDEESGFPGFRISSLIEDHEGYVWIGTKDVGLFRYDGYAFTSFSYDPSDPFSLAGNDVFFVFEDSRNMLWVGTDNALCYYHPYEKEFLKLKLFTTGDTRVVPRNITSITEDGQGNLLIGTNIGIFEISNIKVSAFIEQNKPNINPAEVNVTVKQILLQPDPDIPGKIVKDIRFEPGGLLWILCESELGYIRLSKLRKDIKPADPVIQGNFQTVLKHAEGYRVNIDKHSNKWVSGEFALYRVEGQPGRYVIDSVHYLENSEKIDEFDRKGGVGPIFWIGNYANELRLYDSENRKYYPLTYKTEDLGSLHNHGISCFLRTRSNVLFIGTAWGGLYKFNPNAVLSYFHPNLQDIHRNMTNNLRYVLEDSKGFIWMICKDIYRCNRNTGEVIDVFDEDFFNQPWAYTNKMMEDSDGGFWIGMEGRGLYFMDQDPSTRNNKHKNLRNVIADKTITALHESEKGIILAATVNRDLDSAKTYTELYKIDMQGNVLNKYKVAERLLRNGNETDQIINQIHTGEDHRIWLATGFGLVQLQEDPFRIIDYEDVRTDTASRNMKFLAISPDPYRPDSLLWLGSAERGVFVFEMRNGLLKRFDHAKQIPTNHIASILNDERGNIWLGTDRGVFKLIYDQSGNIITAVYNYDNTTGFITNDFTNYYGANAVKTGNGSMIFTGSRGFQIIEPESMIKGSHIPPLHISNFTVNYKPADYGAEGSVLHKPISHTRNIELAWENNTLGFDIAALDFNSMDNLSYAYMLENYDDNWIENGSNRSILYTRLPPGEYTLKIKATAKDGTWSNSASVLGITILDPWWSTAWAYAFYVLIFILGVWFVDRVQRNRQKLKMAIELNKMESEKLRELDLMKSRFFANISHEFKTPLTLIMNPVDNLLSKTKEETSRKSLALIQRNAKQLQQYIMRYWNCPNWKQIN